MLPALANRFLQLALQLLARYAAWLAAVAQARQAQGPAAAAGGMAAASGGTPAANGVPSAAATMPGAGAAVPWAVQVALEVRRPPAVCAVQCSDGGRQTKS